MGNYKDNKRLIEVRAAYQLNKITNYKNRKKLREHLIILSNVVSSVNEDYAPIFEDLLNNSIRELILGATKKEIYAAMKVSYEKSAIIAKKLDISDSKYRYIYGDLISRDFINDSFINQLEPQFINDEKTETVCRLINTFCDNFNYLTGEAYFDNYDHTRTLELEFYVIYKKLLNVFQNNNIVEKFLYKITNQLNIDWGATSFLLKGLLLITRNNGLSGATQLRQELFNLYYLKGFSISEIGKNIMEQPKTNFYSNGYRKSIKDITESEFEFKLTYTTTLDWTLINKDEILKLIKLFDSFVDANN